MMKALFYIISLFPKPFFVNLLDIYLYTRIYRLFSSFKITKVNLQIAYPDLNQKDIHLLSKLSIKESIISGYETIEAYLELGDRGSLFEKNDALRKFLHETYQSYLSHLEDQKKIHPAFYNLQKKARWIESEMEHALNAGQFSLVYQPQVMARDGVPCGAEALVPLNRTSVLRLCE